MIFGIKMYGNFTPKSRFVAGGHGTNPPLFITYSRVVSRYIVRIGFLLESLNNLDICDVYTGNTYINYKCR